jgi:hypothetical protein
VIAVHFDLLPLAEILMREDDVRTVHALQPMDDGRVLYLIETPFLTFPKYVVGSTNAANDDVRTLLACGAKWSAVEAFEEIALKRGELS